MLHEFIASPRALGAVAKIVVALWFVLFMVGLLDFTHLATLMLLSAGAFVLYEAGVRSELGWSLVAAGLTAQLTRIEGIPIEGRVATWIALPLAVGLVAYFRGTLSARAVVNVVGSDGFEVTTPVGASSHTLHGSLTSGEVSAVFRKTVADLRGVKLARRPAFLDVNCVFGEVEVRVPSHWLVHHKVDSLLNRIRLEFGGALHSIGPLSVARPSEPPQADLGLKDLTAPEDDPGLPHLLIQGSVVFGRLLITD